MSSRNRDKLGRFKPKDLEDLEDLQEELQDPAALSAHALRSQKRRRS